MAMNTKTDAIPNIFLLDVSIFFPLLLFQYRQPPGNHVTNSVSVFLEKRWMERAPESTCSQSVNKAFLGHLAMQV
jgi:hypothetical protein